MSVILSVIAALGVTVVRVHYPAAGHAVTLRGEAPLNWDEGVAMTRIDDQTFEWRSDDAAPREVKPLLDGRWSLGANFTVREGTTNDLTPRFSHRTGRVVTLDEAFASKILGNKRTVRAYLPPGYDEDPNRRFPVLYMQDGQNVFGAQGWNADGALDTLFDGENPPREAIVIAAANAGNARTSEYTPTDGGMGGGRALAYLRMLREELKPRVDRALRTLPDADHTGIAGSSLGGLLSLVAAAERPSDFGFIGAFSPSTWWDNAYVLTRLPALAAARPRPLRIYADCGGDRDGGADTAKLPALMQAAGYSAATFRYVVDDGAPHNESAWARRFPQAVRFLLGPR